MRVDNFEKLINKFMKEFEHQNQMSWNWGLEVIEEGRIKKVYSDDNSCYWYEKEIKCEATNENQKFNIPFVLHFDYEVEDKSINIIFLGPGDSMIDSYSQEVGTMTDIWYYLFQEIGYYFHT